MSDQTTEAEPVVASLLRRVGALLIDGGIQFLLLLALTQALGDSGVEQTSTFAAVLIAAALYNIGFVSTKSATPGKLAMRIWISDGHGNRVRPDQAILRHLVIASGNLSIIDPLLGLIFLVLPLISIFMVLSDQKRRALHDRLAGTLVLSGRPPLPVDEFGRVL